MNQFRQSLPLKAWLEFLSKCMQAGLVLMLALNVDREICQLLSLQFPIDVSISMSCSLICSQYSVVGLTVPSWDWSVLMFHMTLTCTIDLFRKLDIYWSFNKVRNNWIDATEMHTPSSKPISVLQHLAEIFELSTRSVCSKHRKRSVLVKACVLSKSFSICSGQMSCLAVSMDTSLLKSSTWREAHQQTAKLLRPSMTIQEPGNSGTCKSCKTEIRKWWSLQLVLF